MGAVMKVPSLVIGTKQEPLQGKGNPQYGRNGRPVRTLSEAVLGAGGGIHGHVIKKSYSDGQKSDIGISAGLGAALNSGQIKRGLGYRRQAKNLDNIGLNVGRKTELGAAHLKSAAAFKRAGNRNLLMAGAGTAAGAGVVAGIHSIGNARRERATRSQFGKAALMSDSELRRRKKLQANVSIATSTIGLGALGAKGAGGVLHKVGRVKGAARLNSVANNALIGGAGLGGVGGFNFAATQKAEARKRNMGVAKAFDSERNRQNRMKRTETGLKVGGTVAVTGSAAAGAAMFGRDQGVKRMKSMLGAQKIQPGGPKTVSRVRSDGRRVPHEVIIPDKKISVVQGDARKVMRGRLKKVSKLPGMTKGRAGALVGLAGLGVGGRVASDRLESYRHNSGASHRPRYNSPT